MQATFCQPAIHSTVALLGPMMPWMICQGCAGQPRPSRPGAGQPPSLKASLFGLLALQAASASLLGTAPRLAWAVWTVERNLWHLDFRTWFGLVVALERAGRFARDFCRHTLLDGFLRAHFGCVVPLAAMATRAASLHRARRIAWCTPQGVTCRAAVREPAATLPTAAGRSMPSRVGSLRGPRRCPAVAGRGHPRNGRARRPRSELGTAS